MSDKVKILQIGMTPNKGGVENYVMNLYRKMNREDVQFDFIDWYGNENIAYSSEINALGGKIFKIDSRRKSPISNSKQLRNIIKSNNYQYVYYNMNSLSNINGMKTVIKSSKTKLIVHSHTDNITHEKHITKLLHSIHKNIMKNEIIRFACSENAGNWMFGSSEFRVIPNAIDTTNFKFDEEKRRIYKEKFGLVSKRVYGSVARLVHEKNPEHLINVFSEIHKRENNSALVIVGDGVLKSNLVEKVKKMGLEQEVLFLGMRDDISDLMQMMDTMIAPSIFEGFGISVLEAQSMGLRCYVSDVFNDEVLQTPLIQKISLDKTAKEWAIEIIKDQNSHELLSRTSYSENIKKNGYDINQIASELECFFKKNQSSSINRLLSNEGN